MNSEMKAPAEKVAQDTPRTEEALIDNALLYEWGTGKSDYVPAEFARTLERELQAALARVKELERRLAAIMPLFEEARDVLPTITLAHAKLHGLDLTLADRMDDVGVPERWAKREQERPS